ncbi:hypothetical protein BU16DRAFT_473320, partial [Lophium mytilinum]
SKRSKAQYEADGMPMISWPASSPDLNPIENLWKLIKERAEWDKITEEELEELIKSMPKRIQAVIAAQGGPTKW